MKYLDGAECLVVELHRSQPIPDRQHWRDGTNKRTFVLIYSSDIIRGSLPNAFFQAERNHHGAADTELLNLDLAASLIGELYGYSSSVVSSGRAGRGRAYDPNGLECALAKLNRVCGSGHTDLCVCQSGFTDSAVG